jgi:pyridoxine 5-phosphate synthase
VTLRLGVNVDHVATLRQARGVDYPDPVEAALAAEAAGADGITVHLREDRRHIQERDVEALRRRLRVTLNLEMAVTDAMVAFALRVRPDHACFVPERREELTTEGGLDAVLNSVQLKPIVKTLKEGGITVSLFIDPDLEQVKESHKLDADAIEINTAAYSESRGQKAREANLRKVVDGARLGRKLSLEVHAGHGLNYENVGGIAAQSELAELNIGHSIVARATLVGMEQAVREMVEAIRRR